MVAFVLLRVLLIVSLVAANAFFAAAEFALVSVRDTRIQQLIEARRIGARIVLRLHRNLDEVVNGVQLGVTIVSLTLGVAYGAVSGYMGGVVDAAMMRLLDAFLSIPRLLLLLGVLVAWPHLSVGALIFFLGLTGWFGLSRIVRGQVLALKHAEFVTAAQALGASRRRILARHLLPNLVSPIAVAATLGVAHVIVLEAGLSFLGIGVPQPLASWGNIIQDGADQVARLWWLSLFPGLFMVLTVMTLNILGEALRDVYERRT